MSSFRIVTWHGENDTLFYVVKEDETMNARYPVPDEVPIYGTEWEHVITLHSREEAEAYIDGHEG